MKSGLQTPLVFLAASCALLVERAHATIDVPAELYSEQPKTPLAFIPDPLPAVVTSRLKGTGAEFATLSIPLQRALLWDLGLVLSSDGSRYVQVYTKCGKSMSDIFLSKDTIEKVANCTLVPCNRQILTFAYPNCSAVALAASARCAVDEADGLGNAAVKMNSTLWSEEGDVREQYNFTLFKYDNSNSSSASSSTVLYTIYQRPDFQLSGDGTCPNQATAFVVPCQSKNPNSSTVENGGWCLPDPGIFVNAWIVAEIEKVRTDADISKWVQTSTIFIALFCIACLVSGSFTYLFWRKGLLKLSSSASTHYAVLGNNGNNGNNGDGNNNHGGSLMNNLVLTPGPTSSLSDPNTRSSQLYAIDKANEDYLSSSRELVAFCDDEELLVCKIDYDALKFEKLIAKGANGEVWRGEYAGQFVAIKRLLTNIRSDVRAIEIFSREIRLGSSLEHPNIVRFIGLSWRSLAELSMVSEFLAMGDLARFLVSNESRALTWKHEKLSLASDIAKALVYLHSLMPVIIHRDLKSLNILLTAAFEAKLSDFGLSRERSFEETMTMGVGTLLWTAPEVLRGDRYSEKADIYSYGIVLSELDTCLPPYSLNDEVGRLRAKNFELLPLIRNGKISPQFRPDCPPAVLTLAESCLNQNPDKRPNAMQIVYMLQSKVSMSL